MKTKIVKKSASDHPEHQIEDPPYTVFAHTTIPTSIRLTMRVGGLRKIIDENDLKDEDTLRIEVFGGMKATEYSFIRKPNKQINS